MLLRVEELVVAYYGAPASPGGRRAESAPPVVDGVSLSLDAGGALALVGESGSGKTTTALALMGLLPPGARVLRGAIRFEERDIAALDERDRAALRGRRMAMVFQEAGSALHPLHRVIDQLAEPIGRRGDGLGREAARREAVALLASVGIGDAVACAERYPHQLSGGQRQRVLLAMALGGRPSLLIADEPTGSLDATVAAEVLDRLDALRTERGLALLHVTHDLALAAERSDEVAVLFAGRVVEQGPAAAVLSRPAHPYTRTLTAAMAQLSGEASGLPASGPPSRMSPAPGGCRFRGRCPFAQPRCTTEAPPLAAFNARRAVRCHFPLAA